MLDSHIGCGSRKRQRQQEPSKHGTRAQSRFLPPPSRTEPLTLNSFRSFHYARGNKSIIYFIDLCKPIETYIYAKKKNLFASYSATKHSKASNLRLQTYDKHQ